MENTTSINTSMRWVESLALEELNMEKSGVINLNDHLNPKLLLEESSLDFMNQVKDLFETAASRFNEFRGDEDPSRSIKIFKISNTINDFMLYRNSVKLVVARRSPEVVTIGFLSNSGGLFSARLGVEESATNQVHEIRARVGAFNEITWSFKGETVRPQALVKHYFSDFIRHTSK